MPLLMALVLLAVVVAVTCCLPGAFLVVRRQSMLVDALSHAVFPGIVVGAMLAGSTSSPLMVACAVGFGLMCVLGAEKFRRSGLVTTEASQGLVFPALFAVGIMVLSTQISGVHLSESTVLAGELNLMALPSDRLVISGLDVGPRTMWWLLLVLLIDAAFITVTYRTLTLGTFDPQLARVAGMASGLVDATLLVLVTLTVVVAFNAVGSILVIALMVVPAATARLLVRRFPAMLALAVVIAAATATLGLWTAYLADLATAPMMAFVDGAVFLAVVGVRGLRRRCVGSSTSEPMPSSNPKTNPAI